MGIVGWGGCAGCVGGARVGGGGGWGVATGFGTVWRLSLPPDVTGHEAWITGVQLLYR